jgi:hypothetical protein
MRVNLTVPFKEKSVAKSLGAKWDGKTWYVEDKEDLYPFLKWIPKDLRNPHKLSKYENNIIRAEQTDKKKIKSLKIEKIKQAKKEESKRYIK